MKVLLFSTLFPSAVRPVHGVFVETRMRELRKTGEVEVKVVAPVPWFPFNNGLFGEYAKFAATPQYELRNGVQVYHPRYLLPPRVGMNVAPYTLAMGALPTLRRLIAGGFDFDLIDAHYYYPDGVAAMFLARWLNKPFVVTARGTDLNMIPQYPRPRSLILRTAEAARASVGVCKALMDTLEQMGADPAKLHTMSNGVDLSLFRPEDRVQARANLGLSSDGRYLIAVGHLIERKGQHIIIEALPAMPDVKLLLVGDGEERVKLQRMADSLGVARRIKFVGLVQPKDLRWWYSAADASVLCSSREGWANVLLESMACGTPVLATNIWGTPEVVCTPDAGVLISERSSVGLVSAWAALEGAMPSRQRVRAHAERYSWDATTKAQLHLFNSVVNT